MADKLTLIELHLHADGNEFENEMEFSSDIGDILRRRLGFGGSDDESESTTFGTESDDESVVDSLTSPGTTADGGDTIEIEEDDETETGSAVVEIDPDSDPDTDVDEGDEFEAVDEDEESGRSMGRALLILVVLAGLALLARWYLGDDDLEDEFEEL